MRVVATLRKILGGMIAAFAWACHGKASHVPVEEMRRMWAASRGVNPVFRSTNGSTTIPRVLSCRRERPPAPHTDSLQSVKSSLQNERFYKPWAGRSHHETFSKVTGYVDRHPPSMDPMAMAPRVRPVCLAWGRIRSVRLVTPLPRGMMTTRFSPVPGRRIGLGWRRVGL